MSREWKPGDAAVITEYGDETPAVLVSADVCEYRGHGQVNHWHYFAPTDAGCTWASDPNAEGRPLVVIDTEDGESMERLALAWSAIWNVDLDNAEPMSMEALRMRAALRSFAEPEPVEPTDPATRVTDRRENTWRPLADGDWVCTSGPDIGKYIAWDRLAAERGPLEVES